MTEIRCVKCRRLLMKVDYISSRLQIKCPKCGHMFTGTLFAGNEPDVESAVKSVEHLIGVDDARWKTLEPLINKTVIRVPTGKDTEAVFLYPKHDGMEIDKRDLG